MASRSRPKAVDPEKIRTAVKDAGGLVTVPDLASRWFLSKSRVYALARNRDFPQPVDFVGQGRIAIYLACDCDAWKAARAARFQR